MEQLKSRPWLCLLDDAKKHLRRTAELKQQIAYLKEKLEDQPKGDNLGIRSTRISKLTEVKALSNVALSELENWLKAVMKTEETVKENEKEKMVLATWRWGQRKGWSKESICYFLFKKTYAHQTMLDIFYILANRCASFYKN